jgi:hypothetical protein
MTEYSSYRQERSDRFTTVPHGVAELGPYPLAVYNALRRYTDLEYALDDGYAWPSIASIAKRSGVSITSVKRYLLVLRAAGWVAWEQRRDEAGDLTSNRYSVYGSPRPQRAEVGSDRPDGLGRTGPTSRASESYKEEPIELEPIELEDIAHSPQKRDESAFDEFWKVYPRKTGKKPARAAWAKATKSANPARIIAAATEYANDPNRSDSFTKHPATWLNADGWADPPLPARERNGPAGAQERVAELGKSLGFDPWTGDRKELGG